MCGIGNIAIFLSCSELHVEDKYLLFRMFLPNVSIDRWRLLAAEAAVGALKPRLVSALIVHMAVLVPLQGEATTAFLALERLHVVGADLTRTYPRFSAHLGIELAVHSRLILADHVRPERRHHVEPWNTETKMLKDARVRARKKSFYDDRRPFGLGCIIGFPQQAMHNENWLNLKDAPRNVTLHVLSISVFVYTCK